MANFEDDDDLALALQLSREEAEKDQKRRFNFGKQEKNDNSKNKMDTDLAGLGEVEVDNKLHQIDFNPASFGLALQSRLSSVLRAEGFPFSDVTLLVGPKKEKIPAHRIILCTWSNHFRVMLQNEKWKEFGQKELEVHIEEAKIPLFRKVLDYMYGGKIDNLAYSEVLPLLEIADFYGVLSLKEQCEAILSKNIDDENVFGLLDLVKAFNCGKLRVAIGDYFADNFKRMSANGSIYNADLETFAEIIKSDKIEVPSEEHVFAAVLTFVEKIKVENDKKRAIEKLLPLVRFALLSSEFLIDSVETCPAVQATEVGKTLLYDTFRYKAYPTIVPASLTTKTRKNSLMWSSEYCHNNVKVSPDKLTANFKTGFQGSWSCVRAVPAIEGLVYHEVEVTFASYMMIGVETSNNSVHANQYPGQTAYGWSLYSAGQIYHGGTTSGTMSPFTSGSKIGILVDTHRKKLAFYVNGKYNGSSVSNLPKSKVYLVVSFYSPGDKAKLLPQRPFPKLPND